MSYANPISVGEMQHIVRVLVNQPKQDAAGEVIKQLVDFVNPRRAKIEPLEGRALMIAQQVNKDLTHQITMRWFPGLTEEMFLENKGRTFEINSLVNLNESSRWFRMLAKTLE